jgi:hypothetical protein
MPAVLIPALIAAGGSVAAAKIASNAADRQTQLGRDSLSQANQATARLTQQGQGAIDRANPSIDAATKYYQTLLGGNRSAISQAVSPTTGAIRDTFAGARGGIEAGMARGGVRDLALANTNRDEANQVSRVYSGVQPGAAAALMSSGQGLLNSGLSAFGAVPGAYTSQANTGLAIGQTNENASNQAGRDTGAFIFNAMRNKPQSGKSGFSGMGSPSYSWGGNFKPSPTPDVSTGLY